MDRIPEALGWPLSERSSPQLWSPVEQHFLGGPASLQRVPGVEIVQLCLNTASGGKYLIEQGRTELINSGNTDLLDIYQRKYAFFKVLSITKGNLYVEACCF